MDRIDGPQGASVAPPGWSAPATASVVPECVAVVAPAVASVGDAEAAIRWRISAAILDNILVYGGYLLLCGALHWRVASSHLWVFAIALAGYHFVFEARDGQTLGKRRYGIRVVSADGGRASVRAAALRSALRVIDSLPVLYVSGLVSMVRTGPARRQRIGDVAAGTIVVPVDGLAVRRASPGWLLPAATLFAVLVSAVSVYAIATAGSRPLTSEQEAQFVGGCERSPGSVLIDCSCLLTQLEAAGYATPNSLNSLYDRIRAASIERDPAALPPAFIDAARSCRR
jgi:uncharacterized RDD family membrane protein YckC